MKVDDVFANGRWLQSTNISGENHITVGGCYWIHMKHRCKSGSSHQKSRPTYKECKLEFTSFNDFMDWAKGQRLYGVGELDKDLLVKGNKIYSRETCVFIPRAINNALVKNDARRGEYPIGVSLDNNRFRAHGPVDGVRSCLGTFGSPDEAFAAYREAKQKDLQRLANMYRGVIDDRAYLALMDYKVELCD